jgi:hypothetical protein
LKNIYKLSGMSKQSTSRLTPSRKNRVRKPARRAPWTNAMLKHCRALITLAGLLQQSDEDGLETELVNDTGALIDREARQMQALLRHAEKEAR